MNNYLVSIVGVCVKTDVTQWQSVSLVQADNRANSILQTKRSYADLGYQPCKTKILFRSRLAKFDKNGVARIT